MQVIYGPNTASNILYTAQKRLIRPLYAQTQGFPYACSLDPSLRNSDGTFRVPQAGDTGRTAAAFTMSGSIVPGTVMYKTQGEQVAVATGAAAAAPQPMGLLGQWLGGTFDNIGTSNQVGVWMGPDSVYELLAPAWNDSGVASAIATAGTSGAQVLMYAQPDGRLGVTNPGSGAVPVCRIMDRPDAARLVIQLLI